MSRYASLLKPRARLCAFATTHSMLLVVRAQTILAQTLSASQHEEDVMMQRAMVASRHLDQGAIPAGAASEVRPLGLHALRKLAV